MGNFWNGKRRWVALLALLAGFVVMFKVPPVIPVIQLPGEKYPAGSELPLLGVRMTNSLMGSIVVWVLLILLAIYIARRRPKSSAEVPPGGFYNMFEALFEGLLSFLGNIAGGGFFPLIFKMFMTIFLIVLLSNWAELIPTVDSVGYLEAHTEVVLDQTSGEYVRQPTTGYEIYPTFVGGWALNGQCPWVSTDAEQTADETALTNARAAAATVLADAEDVAARERFTVAEESAHAVEATVEPNAEATAQPGAEATAVVTEGDNAAVAVSADAQAEAAYNDTLAARDAAKESRANAGCYTGARVVVWPDYTDTNGTLSYAQSTDVASTAENGGAAAESGTQSETAQTVTVENSHTETGVPEHPVPGSAEARLVPWVVLPYWRAPSTDLNMTLSLALIAFVMIQVVGYRALGMSYFTKFFAFGTLLKSPLGGIDVAVGLLELIGDFAKILSFSFRLLGNIFAGSILLFVMSFLVPFLPWPFFILEFFVGVIQALVFGLLTAIFMNLATIGHQHEEEHAEEGAH